ncbi:MAG: methyltransferase [Candidatus Aminicenantes bacterium]|nr:methyltransferase [Candidatus Aminicenantes bacterium]
MNFLDPVFQILTHFQDHPESNLKLLLNHTLKTQKSLPSPKTTLLVYDIIRRQQILDTVIKRFSRIRLEKIDPRNRVLLRMGVYLLLYSDATPDHAAVNEIVGRSARSSRGFVNALLRNLARQRHQVLKDLQEIRDPKIRYSISPLLVSELNRISANSEEDLQYLNTKPVFHLRANTRVLSVSRLRQHLTDRVVEFRELKPFQSFEVRNPGKILETVVNHGQGFFQNTGSQLVSIVASRYARGKVLDGCCAPGTKSMTLQLLKPDLKIVANDINLKRVRMMQAFHELSRMTAKHMVVSDLTRPALRQGFDFILLDAPCSSSGTMRKNPDLKLKIDRESLSSHSRLQARLLATLLESHPQTWILYSVCSFTEIETEAVLEQVAGKNVRVVTYNQDLSGILDEFGFSYKQGKWGIYLLPHLDLNNDLFYLSLIRREKSGKLGRVY